MEEKKTAKKTVKETEKPIVADNAEIDEELNLDAKITVKNLAGWKVTFGRLHDGVGDIVIAENGEQRLSRNEVQAQINNGNKLFVGTDGRGGHATIYIKDAPTRRWVGFEDADHPQNIFNDDVVKQLFDLRYDEFEYQLPDKIQTRAEKYALVETIKRLGYNDYKKITLVCRYTGYQI